MREPLVLLPLLGLSTIFCCVSDSTVVGNDASPDVTTLDSPADNQTADVKDSGGADAGDGNDGGLPPLTTTATVAIGYGFSCALRASGKIFCWGTNTSGQLGNGLTSTTPSPTPGQVSVILNGARMGAGNDFACAVLTDHTVACWGGNGTGQLGQALSTTQSSTPAVVAGLSGVMDIAVGGSHVCARKSDATVWCWGNNGANQLGHANTSDPACIASIPCDFTPTQVAGLSAIDGIGAGLVHSCAHTGTQALCWGDNTTAQLGHVPGTNGDLHPSTYYNNPTPVAAGATGSAEVFAGGDVSCSINGSQVISCWGYDSAGQLGDQGTNTQSASPVTVSGASLGTLVAPGYVNSCAIANGSAYCWGDNQADEEGTTSGGTSLAPAIPTGLSAGMVVIASNHPGAHHCAQDSASVVYCWGSNNYDECGHANTSDPTCPTGGGNKCVAHPATVSGLP
jgi:alpha-tubulin suppressor-like RCC1 family protein